MAVRSKKQRGNLWVGLRQENQDLYILFDDVQFQVKEKWRRLANGPGRPPPSPLFTHRIVSH